jgi:hypothetical protein
MTPWCRLLIRSAIAIFIAALSSGFSTESNAENSPLERLRRTTAFYFTASTSSIVFPVALAPDTAGLVFIDRATGRTQLIAENKIALLSPRLSMNGEKLLFVRYRADIRELVSCATVSWQCRILLQTTNTIFSPIYVDGDAILYSSSPVTKGSDGQIHAANHNFYLLREGSEPRQLSNFNFY